MASVSRSSGDPAEAETEESAPDRSVREAVVSGSAWAVSVAVLIWGAIYIALGHPGAAAYPFGFLLASVANVVAYRRHRNFRVFAWPQVLAILVTPFLLMVHLGGLIGSGAVGLWSLLGPVGALLLVGHRFAIGTFVAFVFFVAVGLWADRATSPVEALSATSREVFLLLNVLGVSLVAFWAMRIFLAANDRLAAEQRRLRKVERSYVEQEAMLRQQERLATLGKLSAGVAHELNNPAAAAGRATGHLETVVTRLPERAMALMSVGVGAEGLERLWSMADAPTSSNSLELQDREDGLAAWFTARSVPDPWDLAEALAGLGFDVAMLNQATERFNERQVVASMQWIADVARARRLLSEVRTSAGRVSQIVGALKGYSHMDRASDAPIDVCRGIEDTLIILRSQLTGIVVEKDFEPNLPPVAGNAGELNQVWTNLIANAAEALAGKGRILIEARRDNGWVAVSVTDDGPGIPTDLIGSVFDPFVTTKPPGQGTGLGLNLSHQVVVERHRGAIDVESQPGRTRFVVRLPVEGPVSR
ncbi:MAG: sensor histidine kinase [Acidimicrobiia bacterium]